jgi:hypothetical protein
MFEMFVVGPVAASGLGLIHRCIDCQSARGTNAPVCSGFGEGCLAATRPAPDVRFAFDPHQIARSSGP